MAGCYGAVMKTPDAVSARTGRWIREAVVDLGLCPFARVPFEEGRVRIVVSVDSDPVVWASIVDAEASRLLERPSDEVETTLVVLPRGPEDFLSFNELVGEIELRLKPHEGALQLASFHPSFVFADAPADDPGHATNRSPFPTLHLLREASVTAALCDHPDPASIWRRNVRRMREMSEAERAVLSRTDR